MACDVVDHADTTLRSFAFACSAALVSVSHVSIIGTALSVSGVALANRPVTVTFADGQKRTITNAQGSTDLRRPQAGDVDTGAVQRESASWMRKTPVTCAFSR